MLDGSKFAIDYVDIFIIDYMYNGNKSRKIIKCKKDEDCDMNNITKYYDINRYQTECSTYLAKIGNDKYIPHNFCDNICRISYRIDF
jgi:hypothetical protein